MRTLAFLALVPLVLPAAHHVPSPKDQIAAALHAAPEDRRAEAAVLGYAEDGRVIPLKQGSNDLICLADKPGNDSFSVACYHEDLGPFMERGRDLAAQGLKGKERHQVRWKDVDEGRIPMPREPRMLYVVTGKGYDAATDTIEERYLRWVVYTPYATPESSGLTTTPGNEPWLMYPGKAGAHIMISPPK